MNRINDVTMRFRAYQYGEALPERMGGLTPVGKHSFDLTDEDADVILKALGTFLLLSTMDYAHNFQREREDLQQYIRNMDKLQRIAKAVAAKREPSK